MEKAQAQRFCRDPFRGRGRILIKGFRQGEGIVQKEEAMILDSTFFIDLLRKVPQAIKASKEIEHHITKASSVSVFEVYKEIHSRKTHEQIDELFDSIVIIPLDRTIAQRGGELWLELQKKGEEIDPEDCLIAATALHEQEPLITRNGKHFSRIPALQVIS